jgi:hypothetical protein
MDRTDRPSVRPSVTSLYNRFTPMSVIYDNPGKNNKFMKRKVVTFMRDSKCL